MRILSAQIAGRSAHAQAAVHQPGLDLGAQDDVQVVGEFVGLDPDQARARRVDRPPEIVDRNVGELVGEFCLECGEILLPEAPRPADAVLPQPRLRFMRAEAGAADRVEIDEVGREDRAGEVGRDALLVDAVAGFMPDGEEAAGQPVLAEAAGDADVGAREGNLERMNRVVEPAALEIVAHAGGYRLRERLLLLDRIGAFKNVDAGRRRLQRGLRAAGRSPISARRRDP